MPLRHILGPIEGWKSWTQQGISPPGFFLVLDLLRWAMELGKTIVSRHGLFHWDFLGVTNPQLLTINR